MYLENCCCYVVNLLFKTCDLERIQSIKNNFTGKFYVSQDFKRRKRKVEFKLTIQLFLSRWR